MTENKVTDIVPLEDVNNLHIRDLVAEDDIVKALTTDQVFQVLKNSVQQSSEPKLQAMLHSCIALKDHLEMTGQNDLLSTLTTRIKDIGLEYKVLESGHTFFIYRKDVNKIIDSVNNDKGFTYLKLTKLENYMRLIPPESSEAIKKAKEYFPVMYVLHTDPKGSHKAEEDRVKKDKDPILFGMTGTRSEKMYLICSWEDKYCDFTLPELLDLMSEKLEGDAQKLGQLDIPTTVEELVDNMNESNGIWITTYENHIVFNKYEIASTTTSNTGVQYLIRSN